jgi:hypothetical protein
VTSDQVFIKVRVKGTKRWYFAMPSGDTTLLRIKAARFSKAQAELQIAEDTKLNPGLEFKIAEV